MKKLESSLKNMVLVLTGVAVVMGGILAFVNHLTEGPISQQKEKALADGIKTVMVCDNLVVDKTDEVKQNDAKGNPYAQGGHVDADVRYRVVDVLPVKHDKLLMCVWLHRCLLWFR